MDDFYNHICRKSEHGIPYKDAVQLMFWIFLTLVFIPKEFQGLELSKSNLAILFSKLSANKKITIGSTDHVHIADVAHPEHWENLVNNLLQKKLSLDETFPERFGLYV